MDRNEQGDELWGRRQARLVILETGCVISGEPKTSASKVQRGGHGMMRSISVGSPMCTLSS